MPNSKFKTAAQVEEALRAVTAQTLGIEKDRVQLTASYIDDLSADSLDTVELVMNYEELFEYEIPDDAAETILTVGDAIHFTIAQYKHDEKHDDFTTTVLAFRLGANGKIEVGLRGTDGSWLFADGAKRLAAGIYLLVFNRWSEILKELEEMINHDTLNESDLQNFFERHPDLLKGDDYDQIVPQAIIRPDDQKVNWRADFVLHPRDQTNFSKIVELKLPSQPLIKRDQSGHTNFYFGLHAAVQQLRDYGAAFLSKGVRENFKRAYGIDVFRPDLQLIVGRRWEVNHVDTMLERQRRDAVEIIDWDTTVDRMRRKFT